MASNDNVWYNEFGAEFWLVVSGSLFAFLGVALRACLQSRCSKVVMCCGAWECRRDPAADQFEADEDQSDGLKMEEGT